MNSDVNLTPLNYLGHCLLKTSRKTSMDCHVAFYVVVLTFDFVVLHFPVRYNNATKMHFYGYTRVGGTIELL